MNYITLMYWINTNKYTYMKTYSYYNLQLLAIIRNIEDEEKYYYHERI